MELGITMLKQLVISSLQQESINIMICTHGLDLEYILLINFWQFCTFSLHLLLYLFLLISGLPFCFKDKLLMDGGNSLFHHVWDSSLELS